MVCRSIGCKNLKGQIHDNLAEVVVPEREQKNIRDPQMPLSVLVRVRDLRLKSGAHGSWRDLHALHLKWADGENSLWSSNSS